MVTLSDPRWNQSSHSVHRQLLVSRWQTTPKWAWSKSHDPLLDFGAHHISEKGEARHVIFVIQIQSGDAHRLPPSGMQHNEIYITTISCRWQIRATHCIKLTMLRVGSHQFSATTPAFNLPHQHLGVTEFGQDFRHQKNGDLRLLCGVVCMILQNPHRPQCSKNLCNAVGVFSVPQQCLLGARLWHTTQTSRKPN